MPKSRAPKSHKQTVLSGRSTHNRARNAAAARASNKNFRGSDIFDAEEILAYKISADNADTKMVYFLVKWEDFDISDATWESAVNCRESWHLIVDFLKNCGKRIVVDKANKAMFLEDLEDWEIGGEDRSEAGENKTESMSDKSDDEVKE